MTKRVVNSFAGIRNVIGYVRNINANFHLKYVHFKGDKIAFKKSYIKRILQSWSFHTKFIKLAEGSFNNFHTK